MFETGRWRRYYSEYVFLENIKEAKLAVETWRALSTPDPARNSIIVISWSAPERAMQPRKTSPRADQAPPSRLIFLSQQKFLSPPSPNRFRRMRRWLRLVVDSLRCKGRSTNLRKRARCWPGPDATGAARHALSGAAPRRCARRDLSRVNVALPYGCGELCYRRVALVPITTCA